MTSERIQPELESPLSTELIKNSSMMIQEIFRGYRDKQLRQAGSISFKSKADGSLVTELDEEIENSVHDDLLRQFPEIPVFGEEAGYNTNPSRTFWLIDPIDGTKSFIDGTPTFTNMAALIHEGSAVASIIYNPTQDNMFAAFRGEGAFKNSERLNIRTMAPAPIVYCKTKLFPGLSQIIDDVNLNFTSPPPGGGHGLTLVAQGLILARFQLLASGVAHDYAPGALLVEEAGGINIPIRDDVYTYNTNSFIACHPSMAGVLNLKVEQIKSLER